MTTVARQSLLTLGIGLVALITCFATAAPQAKAASFQEGVIEVNGYGWTTDPVTVQLSDIAQTDDGATTYTVRDILQDADPRSGQFNLDTVPGVAVILPESVQSISCTGDQVRAESASCPLFTSTSDYTEMRFKKNGQTKKVRYKDFNPEIYVEKPDGLNVTLSPASRKIKSGNSVTFTATVSGATGNVTYDWNFGDGQTSKDAGKTITHKFTGDGEQFVVVVSASTEGQRGDDAFATIIVGKVKKQKPEKKPDDEEPEDNETSGDPGYIPGYSDGGYGGYGGGTGGSTGSPSTGSPTPQPQPKDPEPKPPVDDGLETVSGQLVDPSQISAITPPADPETPSTATQPDEEAGDSGGGGGISDGALTAIGIGALLGLGGLAEAGAFAGFRRFRFRP